MVVATHSGAVVEERAQEPDRPAISDISEREFTQ